MVNDITGNGSVKKAGTADQSSATPSLTNKNEQLSKDQFLQLLVTQLKNQDPLDPMKSEDFAVNLAQFSQLEQLMSINQKIQGGGTDASSLASYLGHDITLNSSTVHVDGGDGGVLQVKFPSDSKSVEVEILDSQGTPKQVLRFDDVPAGTQSLVLNGLKVSNGDYGFKIRATNAAGVVNLDGRPGGTVTGFVPGPDPKLLVGTREVSPSDVVEVGLASTGSSKQ